MTSRNGKSRNQMRWLPNLSFSSSSPSSSSSAASSPKPDETVSPFPKPSRKFYDHRLNYSTNSNHYNVTAKRNNNNNGRGGAFHGGGGPRLTRQRKLRHLTEHDVCVSSDSEAAPRSVSPAVLSSRLSAPAAVPLPLPFLGPGGDLDGGGGGSSPSPSPLALFGKASDHIEIKPPRRVRPDLSNVDNFGIKVAAKSGSTSPFASPVRSPQRASPYPADIISYYNGLTSKGAQVWSAPELAMLDLQGLPPPAFMDFSDTSPLPSPPRSSPRPSGPPSPLTARESPFVRRESNATLEVHPLPLPPGAPAHSPPPSFVPQPMPRSESPTPLKSQWQKGKLIGRGTFGSVYVASNRVSGALCAMKEVEIFPDDPKSAECIKQLEQEIKVLSQLKHQNIVQYYGSEMVEGHFYIYIEYVHPGSINKYIHDHCGAMTENVVRSFTRHILSGLAYLHGKKTIHRDIKGANLLVDASGVVKLADFGMAKHLSGRSAILSLKGSPYWMAPELMQSVMQKDNSSDLAFAIDIWSLGCTIIEMFTGKPPWSDYEGAAAMFKVLKDTPPIPESLSPEGKDFLSCCLKRNPAERSTACVLLDHRWLKDLQQLDVASSAQLVNGLKLTDSSHSPRKTDARIEPSSVLPSRSVKGKVISYSSSFMQNNFSPVRLGSDPP